MPIIIPKDLPARKVLKKENVFVMNTKRAIHQDIRALEILVLNLMPTKKQTETQLLRLLSNTPLQINVTFLTTETYKPQNISKAHLESFYKTFREIKDLKFDGMIITGAPVEKMNFEDVGYWDELTKIMDYSQENVTSVLHICWGAQAGLYHHYGIQKFEQEKKTFGVFKHKIDKPKNSLLNGFDDYFYAPHSRYTKNKLDDLINHDKLNVLAHSDEVGLLLAISKDNKNIFSTGHLEYTKDILHKEYLRDLNNGIKMSLPKNYYTNNSVGEAINNKWRSHAYLLFMNWINYYIYQKTPYNLNKDAGK